MRKPKEYEVRQAGDLVQLDTLHDVASKWNVVSVYRWATATTATRFLDALAERMPFPVKAIQVEGGAEFEAFFEEEYQRRGIKLFVLPPRSPKLNGGVEGAYWTDTEEFYRITDSTFEIEYLKGELLEWEHRYNTVRPHQALGYLTPLKFLEQQDYGKEVRCH